MPGLSPRTRKPLAVVAFVFHWHSWFHSLGFSRRLWEMSCVRSCLFNHLDKSRCHAFVHCSLIFSEIADWEKIRLHVLRKRKVRSHRSQCDHLRNGNCHSLAGAGAAGGADAPSHGRAGAAGAGFTSTRPPRATEYRRPLGGGCGLPFRMNART